MKKWISALTLLALLAGGMVFYIHERQDVHHTAYRRDWKNNAIREIRSDITNPKYFIDRFGAEPKQLEFPDPSEGVEQDEEKWRRADTILCADGSWLIYRSRCHKEDGKIHDIFIAYASDKKWYYSDFHFCIGAMVAGMHGQPASLEDFRMNFYLKSFDGKSDAALDPTWKQ
jgi:hypothetical protein